MGPLTSCCNDSGGLWDRNQVSNRYCFKKNGFWIMFRVRGCIFETNLPSVQVYGVDTRCNLPRHGGRGSWKFRPAQDSALSEKHEHLFLILQENLYFNQASHLAFTPRRCDSIFLSYKDGHGGIDSLLEKMPPGDKTGDIYLCLGISPQPTHSSAFIVPWP